MTLESFPALSSVIFKVGASRAIIMQTLITSHCSLRLRFTVGLLFSYVV